MKHHRKTVTVIVQIRNGDGNYLEEWRGEKVEIHESVSLAALKSFEAAMEHKSPVTRASPRHD